MWQRLKAFWSFWKNGSYKYEKWVNEPPTHDYMPTKSVRRKIDAAVIAAAKESGLSKRFFTYDYPVKPIGRAAIYNDCWIGDYAEIDFINPSITGKITLRHRSSLRTRPKRQLIGVEFYYRRSWLGNLVHRMLFAQ